MGKERDHYSTKGGHQVRGEVNRTQRSFERKFPGVSFTKPEYLDARRSMRRAPQSGKRNPKQS